MQHYLIRKMLQFKSLLLFFLKITSLFLKQNNILVFINQKTHLKILNSNIGIFILKKILEKF